MRWHWHSASASVDGRVAILQSSSEVDDALVRLAITAIRIADVEIESLRTLWYGEYGNPIANVQVAGSGLQFHLLFSGRQRLIAELPERLRDDREPAIGLPVCVFHFERGEKLPLESIHVFQGGDPFTVKMNHKRAFRVVTPISA